jgi:hypothetical protein
VGQAFGEVRHGSIAHACGSTRIGSVLNWELGQRTQHLASAIGGVFERVCLLVQPGVQLGGLHAEHWLSGCRQVLDGVRKIQDTHRIRSEHIHQALLPFGPILNRAADEFGRFGPAG